MLLFYPKYVNTGHKLKKKKAWTYCGQLAERLGIGIWTQVAVDVWAHEGRESNQDEVGQGAAGLQG